MKHQLYISPFTLMSWESSEIPAKGDILSAKKQRLAELEASGEIYTVIQERSYTKDDIIKTFDAILSDPYMHFHLHVKNDKALLHFLETGDYSSAKPFASQTIYRDAEFRQWLQPYFAAAFSVLADWSIETQSLEDLVGLLRENIKIDPEHEAEAWEPLRNELTEASSYLELYEKDFSWESQQESIRELSSVPFLQLITLKPAHLFYDETCEYTRLLHNVACAMVHRPSACVEAYIIWHNLLNLELYPSLKETCRNNRGTLLTLFTREYKDFPGTWAINLDQSFGKPAPQNSAPQKSDDKGCLLAIMPFVVLFTLIALVYLLSDTNKTPSPTIPTFPNIPSYAPPKIDYDINKMLNITPPKGLNVDSLLNRMEEEREERKYKEMQKMKEQARRIKELIEKSQSDGLNGSDTINKTVIPADTVGYETAPVDTVGTKEETVPVSDTSNCKKETTPVDTIKKEQYNNNI